MKQPILSIIVPVYNTAQYLRRAIDSYLPPEGCDDVEIIITDDGSTDGSAAICREYAEKHTFIKVIRQQNAGLSEARNAALREARGVYIICLDSDDYLRPGSVAKIVELARHSDVDVIMTRAYSFSTGSVGMQLGQVDYSTLSTAHPAAAFAELLRNPDFWFAAWLLIVKREFLLMNGLLFTPGIYHEDDLWVPQVFLLARTARFVNDAYYCYWRDRSGSIMNRVNIQRAFDVVKICDMLGDFSGITPPGDEVIRRHRAAMLHGLVLQARNYRDDPRYPILKEEIMKRAEWLDSGKFAVVRMSLRVAGLDATSRMLNLRHRRSR